MRDPRTELFDQMGALLQSERASGGTIKPRLIARRLIANLKTPTDLDEVQIAALVAENAANSFMAVEFDE
jgi:hypothetical protein